MTISNENNKKIKVIVKKKPMSKEENLHKDTQNQNNEVDTYEETKEKPAFQNEQSKPNDSTRSLTQKDNSNQEQKNKIQIEEIADYIQKCLEVSKKYSDEIIVFRGETEDFGKTSCIPNIFRKRYLEKNPFFEKNLLDEMTANNMSYGNSYLEKAINAQHDGFPSRLLDVSFNCLVGLHFAITPYYKEKEDSKDNKNGYVYIYHFRKSFSALGDGIAKNYDSIIKHDTDWCSEHYFFSSNFKFIEHMKINERIKAQNGAFILFQGDEPSQIPEYMFEKIEIPMNVKKRFRSQLRDLFDIDNGTMYPEVYNLVEKISEKSLRESEFTFSLRNELGLSLYNFEREIDEHLILLKENKSDKGKIIREVERKIINKKNAFGKYCEVVKNKAQNNESDYSKELEGFREQFNQIVTEAREFMIKYIPKDYEIADKNSILI